MYLLHHTASLLYGSSLWLCNGSVQKTIEGFNHQQCSNLFEELRDCNRRSLLATVAAVVSHQGLSPAKAVTSLQKYPNLSVVADPQTYTALAYTPLVPKSDPPPLILVVHGAGRNELDIVDSLANPSGEHAGLIPSLIASEKAPPVLTDNFAVLAPYSFGKRSFYEEPRGSLLKFLDWAGTEASGCPKFDPRRVILFGFSDGATVAVELLTTNRFAAGVICAYGYTAPKLPKMALQRLTGIPMWVFHSADDVIFPVSCSDRLVKQLRDGNKVAGISSSIVRYSRFDRDQEGFTGSVRGHSTGITASRTPELYEWMLNDVPRMT